MRVRPEALGMADHSRSHRPVLVSLFGFAFALLFAVFAAGCSSPSTSSKEVTGPKTESARAVFTGEIPGSSAFMGLVKDGENVLAYVCDSDSISRWFRGKVDTAGVFNLVHPSGDTLSGTLIGDKVKAAVAIAGKTLPVDAFVSQGKAGLYRAQQKLDGVERVAGWIVLSDGRQRGAVQQTGVVPAVTAAPVLDPAAGTAGTFQAAIGDATPPTTTAPPVPAPTNAPAPTTPVATAPGATTTPAPTATPGATTTPAATTTPGATTTPSPTIASSTTPSSTTAVASSTTPSSTTAVASSTTAASSTTIVSLSQVNCQVTLMPGRVFDLQLRAQPLTIGFPNLGQLNLGTVSATGPCDDNAVVNFSAGSANLYRGFLSGSALSGTIDKSKTCFNTGTFSARSDLGLPVMTIVEPLCIGYNASFKATSAVADLFPGGAAPTATTVPATTVAPGAVGIPANLGQPCPGTGVGALKGVLRFTGGFPALQLPAGTTFREGLLDFTCDRIRFAAQVAVAGGAGAAATPTTTVAGAINAARLIAALPGTITFNGTARNDNSFDATVDFSGVPVLGSPVDFTGTVQGAATGALNFDIAARLTNATLGIPGFNLKTGEVRFTRDQMTVSGKATAGNGEVALTLNGAYRAEDDFSVTLTADSTDPKGAGNWKPAGTLIPSLDVPRGNFSGTMSRTRGPLLFDVKAALSAPVTIVNGTAVVNTASVRISNATTPVGCPVQAGEAWIDLNGSGRLSLPQSPVVDLAVSSCLGLQSGGFRLATTANLNSWKPRADVDLTVEGFGFEVRSVSNQLQIAGSGELKFAQARGLARMEFRSPNTLIIDGGVNMADLQVGGGTGHLILATQPVTGYVNPADPQLGSVDLVAGLTAVASINLDADTRTFLVQKLGVPQGSVPERLQAKAQIGGAAVQLEAALQFPTPGLPMYQSCPEGQPCTADTKTSLHLESIFFRVDTTGSLGLGAAMNLHLPKPNASQGSPSDVKLVGVLTVTPPATLGLKFTMLGTLNNALGIEGFNLSNVALQGSLDFSASGIPVPLELGFTATVSSLPTFMKQPLGVVGDEPMKFALNISPVAPIFQVTLGTADNVTFLKPLTVINNGQFKEELTVDFAEVYFAPFGGKIGEIVFTPGINIQFDGRIAGTLTKAQIKLDPTTLTMEGKLLVDKFTISGAEVRNTDLRVLMTPTKFDMTIKGGFALPNGPVATIDGHLLVQATATDPIRLDLIATADNWTVNPGNTFSTFSLEAHGGLPSLSGAPNLSLTVNANGQVLGTPLTFGGALVFQQNELRYLGLQVNPGTMTVSGTTISGSGCTKALVVPRGITAVVPPTTTSGVCVQFSYAKPTTAAAQIAMAINGKLTSAGINASVNGSVDATGLAFTGTLDIPQFSTTIDGRLFSGTAASLAAIPVAERPLNAQNVAVLPVTGDWRLAGTFAPKGGFDGTSLKLIGGRVGGADFVKGNGALVIGGQRLADGNVTFTSAQMILAGGLELPLPPKVGQAPGKLTVNVSGTSVYPTATTGLDVTFNGNVSVSGGGVTSTATAAFRFVERPAATTNRLDLDATATAWPLNPSTRIDRLVVGFHGDIPKTGLAANATMTIAADITVLDTQASMNGSGTMTNGVVTAFDLSVGANQIVIGTTTIGGKGCPGQAVKTGPCIELKYAASPTLLAQIKVNGTLVTPGLSTTFNGTAGTTGIDFTGSTTMPNADVVTVNGTIITANGSGIAVIKVNADGTETSVPGVKGDVSFGGTWSPSGLLAGSNLSLRSGGVGGAPFGQATGNLRTVGLGLGTGRVTFTSTTTSVFGDAALPLPALPGCTALAGVSPLNVKVTGSLTATEMILTGSQGQPTCSNAPSIEGRIEVRKAGATNTLLLKGTAKNWTFGPTKLVELSASVSSATSTSATIFAKATLLDKEFVGNGTATMSGGRVTAFNMSASSEPIILSPATTLTAVPNVSCGPTALGGPCFNVDFNATRPAPDQLRATFSTAATVSGLRATLQGSIGNGQSTVQGTLDTGQFGEIEVVGALFTDTPTTRVSAITKDGVSYNLASIATAAGTSFSNATKGDFVLGVKGGTPTAGSIAGFPVANFKLNAGRIGSTSWIRGEGSIRVGESTVNIDGIIAVVLDRPFLKFHGDGNIVINGFTLASAEVDLTKDTVKVKGRVTVPNPGTGPDFVDVLLDGRACMTRCAILGTADLATDPGFSFDLSGEAALRLSGFNADGSFRFRKVGPTAAFTFAGGLDTAVLTANISGSLTKSGTTVSLCARGTGSLKTNGANPTGTVSFCTNPAKVTVELDRGDYHFEGTITSTSISLDASTEGVWLANDWHEPCRDFFKFCRDRVEYTLQGKVRLSTSGTPSFSVSGSGDAQWRTDRNDTRVSSSARKNSVFVADVSFSTTPLQVCINIGGQICSPSLG